jgi:hypothetical protein
MKLPLTRSNSLNSAPNLRSLYSSESRAGGASAGGNPSPVKSTMKVVGVGILCFIGGMQVDRGSIVQINFSSYVPHTSSEEASAKNDEIGSGSDAAPAVDDDAKEIAATAAKVFKEASDAPVERIILLGERHSGTNWITDHLQECFGDMVIVSGKLECNCCCCISCKYKKISF